MALRFVNPDTFFFASDFTEVDIEPGPLSKSRIIYLKSASSSTNNDLSSSSRLPVLPSTSTEPSLFATSTVRGTYSFTTVPDEAIPYSRSILTLAYRIIITRDLTLP